MITIKLLFRHVTNVISIQSWKSRIKPGIEVKKLFNYCKQLNNLNIIGVHSYDGHLIDSDEYVRLTKAEEGYKTVLNLVNDLEATGNISLCIVAGSSPTLNFYGRTCNLYESSMVIEKQKVTKHWSNTARSRKLSI